MAKVQKSNQNIIPLAGIYFLDEAFTQSWLSKLIDNELGMRSLSGYQYSEIFRNIFNIFYPRLRIRVLKSLVNILQKAGYNDF